MTRRAFAAEPGQLTDIRSFVRTEARRAGLAATDVDDMVLAVSEASANAIVHGGGRRLFVESRVRSGCYEVAVADDGIFRRRVRMPEVEGAGGHGIPLMLSVTDELSIVKGTPGRPGTMVRLVKCR